MNEVTSGDVANWYFLTVASLYASLKGLFSYNLFTDFFGATDPALSLIYIAFGVSGIVSLIRLLDVGPKGN